MASQSANGEEYDNYYTGFNITVWILWVIVEVLYDSLFDILLYIVTFLFLYSLYKAYWSPVILKRELTYVGFDHVPCSNGRDRSLLTARALKSRHLSPKIPSPYPNGWYALAESMDLAVGAVIPVDALGQNFCVYRGEDGVARIVDAYCPHLGANLGVGGAVKGNCIECPFHKWRFGENGICKYIPDVKNIPKGISIKSWQCMEVDGAVWVWYDSEGRAPLWEVPPLEHFENWGYRGRNEFLISGHIQDIPENGADASHLKCVHKFAFWTDIGRKIPFLNHLIGYHVWKADWSRTEDWHITKITLEQNFHFMKFDIFNFVTDVRQIGPGHVRLIFSSKLGPCAISQSVTPLGPMLQKVVHRVYTPAYNALFGAAAVHMEACQFERDVAIWNNKRYVSSPPYSKTDRNVRAFRDWFAQFYSAHSLNMRDALRQPLDW